MARNRLDDEEALIPRSDTEEFHAVTRKNAPKRCHSCCSLKCWFFLFLILAVVSTVLFYFLYPSAINEHFDKLMGFACKGYSGRPNKTVTCLVMTSQENLDPRAVAINQTWGKQCTNLYFFYDGAEKQTETNVIYTNNFLVHDVNSVEPITIAYNRSSTSSWYLVADDTSFVVFTRLQRLLATDTYNEELVPTFIGDGISNKTGTYLLNKAAMKRVAKSQQGKTARQVIKSTNVTSTSARFSGNPMDTKRYTATQILNMTDACAFNDVTPTQMIAFYIINSDNVL